MPGFGNQRAMLPSPFSCGFMRLRVKFPQRCKRGFECTPEPAKSARGLTGKELAGLEMAIQERATADEAFFSWLRRDRELSVSEWRKRRASAERARRAEDAYIEKLFKTRSAK